MDISTDAITVAALFTIPGAAGAALVIRQLVELIKGTVPGIDAKVSGALQAFVLSAALYVFGSVALPVHDANGALLAVVSWLACATGAVGINAAWDKARAAG